MYICVASDTNHKILYITLYCGFSEKIEDKYIYIHAEIYNASKEGRTICVLIP